MEWILNKSLSDEWKNESCSSYPFSLIVCHIICDRSYGAGQKSLSYTEVKSTGLGLDWVPVKALFKKIYSFLKITDNFIYFYFTVVRTLMRSILLANLKCTVQYC